MSQEEPELDKEETDVMDSMRSQCRLCIEVEDESGLGSYNLQEEGAKE